MLKLIYLICCGCILTVVSAQRVTPWLTQGNQAVLFAQRPRISFGGDTLPVSATITIDGAVTFQSVDGFGFCLTQGSAQVIQGLRKAPRTKLLNDLFAPTGLRVSAIRISMGASDLSNAVYSYNETDGDVDMLHFSLDGPDKTYLIPLLKDILAINPSVKILATPWTAPTWMKTNRSWIGGKLQPDLYSAYARYFVKYLEAMDEAGIPIWGITPQNEPENPNNEPSMEMTASEQIAFINDHLGPQIARSPYRPKIIAFDHNCDHPEYPTQVLNSSPFVDGAAFHLYAGDISVMSEVHAGTGKNVYFTEQFTSTHGNFGDDLGWHIRNVVIGSLNNHSKAVFEWNLAADQAGGPRTPGGCSECLPAVTVPNAKGYRRNVAYYIIAHVSKFISPGAVRIRASSSTPHLHAVGFDNPNGQRVLVAYNDDDRSTTLRVQDKGQAFDYSLPGKSVVTFSWSPN